MTLQAITVAALQTAPLHLSPDDNRANALSRVAAATAAGAQLIVLPECAISGYAMNGLEEARHMAEPLDGPTTTAIRNHCAATGTYVAFGLLEREADALFNSAVLVGPRGVVGRHRKAHIAPVAADMHVLPGDDIAVFEALGLRLGMMICYEVRFPEIARAMALQGAQVILVLANWPTGADVNPDIMSPARAAENNVHLLAANRTGTEGALSFIGKSAIFAPSGQRMAQAGEDEQMLIARIMPGKGLGALDIGASGYTVDLRLHRRPDLYTALTEWEDRR